MKKLFLGLLVFLYLFCGVKNVNALSNDSILRREFVPNVWAFHFRDGKVFTYGQLNIKYINGKLGYCIEPNTAVNTNVYSSTTDWSSAGFNPDSIRHMNLIAHYGYGYKDHSSIRWYMAAQELIWNYCSEDTVRWTTEDHSDSEIINVAHEKNEILRLCSGHNKIPSFSDKSYSATIGDTLTFTDTNSVLRFRNIRSNSDYNFSYNTLSIPIKDRKEINMEFYGDRNIYDNDAITYYYADIRSQRVATFSGLQEVSSSIKIVPNKTKVEINKKDRETNLNIPSSDTTFKIKKKENDEYIKKDDNEELNTNENGSLSLELEDGDYELEEVKASDGYYINDEKKIISINENNELENNVLKIDYFNEKVKGRINIKKVDDSGKLISGCEFEIYDKEMNVVDKITSTNKEYDSSKLLPLGIYYVKEIKTLDGYKIDNKVYKLELEYKDDKTGIIEENVTFINEKIRCDVLFISMDNKNNTLNKVNISVYDDNDKLVYKGTTDKNGEVKIGNVHYGDYYLVETKVPNGYELNEERVNFTINDDCCLASLKLNNNKIKMPKTTARNNDILCMMVIIINLGIIKIVKKNN